MTDAAVTAPASPPETKDRVGARSRGGRGSRLRRSVFPVDRPAHPRLWRLLRAVAASRPAGGGRQAQTARDHPLRRPAHRYMRLGAAWSAGCSTWACRSWAFATACNCSSTSWADVLSRPRWASSVAPSSPSPSLACSWRGCPSSRLAGCLTATRFSRRQTALPRSGVLHCLAGGGRGESRAAPSMASSSTPRSCHTCHTGKRS